MRCRRCAGLKVPEVMLDGGMRVTAYRCVHCGDVVDAKILLNRTRRSTPILRRPRTPIYGSARWKKRQPAPM